MRRTEPNARRMSSPAPCEPIAASRSHRLRTVAFALYGSHPREASGPANAGPSVMEEGGASARATRICCGASIPSWTLLPRIETTATVIPSPMWIRSPNLRVKTSMKSLPARKLLTVQPTLEPQQPLALLAPRRRICPVRLI